MPFLFPLTWKELLLSYSKSQNDDLLGVAPAHKNYLQEEEKSSTKRW